MNYEQNESVLSPVLLNLDSELGECPGRERKCSFVRTAVGRVDCWNRYRYCVAVCQMSNFADRWLSPRTFPNYDDLLQGIRDSLLGAVGVQDFTLAFEDV